MHTKEPPVHLTGCVVAFHVVGQQMLQDRDRDNSNDVCVPAPLLGHELLHGPAEQLSTLVQPLSLAPEPFGCGSDQLHTDEVSYNSGEGCDAHRIHRSLVDFEDYSQFGRGEERGPDTMAMLCLKRQKTIN